MSEKDCKDGEHCWHNKGVKISSYPPIDVYICCYYICCYCGEEKRVRQQTVDEKAHHGPFHPARIEFKLSNQ